MLQNENQDRIEERVKRADLNAADAYDLERIQRKSGCLLDCVIQEEKETLLFIYDRKESMPFTLLREEELYTKYIALMDVAGLKELHEEFLFSLSPGNLYYDINAKVKVKSRDIYGGDQEDRDGQFLDQYKALTGAVLQDRYSYEDYFEGGLDLLKKNRFLSRIYTAESIGEVKLLLMQAYVEKKQRMQQDYCSVNKRKYLFRTAMGAVMTVLALGLSVIVVYAYSVFLPGMKAVIAANQNYYDSDYIGVIDDLQGQELSQMDIHTRCILAESYVRSESLTMEQKENILSLITVNGNVKYINYWIELGRGNFSEAENIAMQISDDELLIYAYMKERSRIESDDSIAGTEKAELLSELQKKIDALSQNDDE